MIDSSPRILLGSLYDQQTFPLAMEIKLAIVWALTTGYLGARAVYSMLSISFVMIVMVNSEYRIRPMVPGDVGGLEEIIGVSFSWFPRFFALRSMREGRQVLVSEAQGAGVVGFAKLIDFQVGGGKFGCILWVAVHPRFRRRGIAAALVNAGLEHLKHAEVKAVFATVQRRNTASLVFFSRQGFRRMGFLELRRLFGGRIFKFYSDIWLSPGEVVLMHD